MTANDIAHEILNDADIIEEFEDRVFIKIDIELWNAYWEAIKNARM